MANEKRFTAKEAAQALLKKTHELLQKSELMKAQPIGQFGDKDAKRVTGHEKGVHKPVGDGTKSSAGMGVLHAQPGKMNPKEGIDHAKNQHKRVLGEMKDMPKPNLGKAENVTPPDGVQKSPNPEQQEVNGNPGPGANPQNYGSEYKGHLKLAKFIGHMESKRKTRESSAQPPAQTPAPGAPGMVKGETGHEKGVHRSLGTTGEKSGPVYKEPAANSGLSHAGNKARPWSGSTSGSVDKPGAVAEHKKVLGEMKAAPKPKLPG